jgi:LysM repeat protein
VEARSVWLQRYGGHLVLGIVGLSLLLVARSEVAERLFAFSLFADGQATPTATAFPAATVVASAPAQAAVARSIAPGAVPVLQDVSLVPAPNPRTFRGKAPAHEFATYIVERSDTPGAIAQQFGIKPETLLGGNPSLSQEANLLQVGAELIILPVDGALHTVTPGETVESIAVQYDVPAGDIIAYGPNNLEFPFRLIPDTQLLIPGAVVEPFKWEPPSLVSIIGNSPEVGNALAPLVVGTGAYIWPVNSRNFTQYYWWGHRGIDIGLSEGTAVVAADTGTVTFAGPNVWCYGNLVVINHGNGAETFYAHLSAIGVYPGQVVYQGNVIGSSGNTGCSSGPHLHFEIRWSGSQDDPLFYLP